MKITKLSEVNGRLCVFLDVPNGAGSGGIAMMTLDEQARTREAILAAMDALTFALEYVPDKQTVDRAIQKLGKLTI